MEETVVNRLTALLLVMTMAAGTAFGQGSNQGRPGNSPVRQAHSQVVPARSSSVPRPAKPSTRLASHNVVDQGNMVENVDYDEPMSGVVLGESYNPNEGLAEIGGGCTSCGGGGCDSCGTGCGNSCGNPFAFDLCNPGCVDGRQLCLCLPSHGWVSVEYLNWYQRGMESPALVTTSPSTPTPTPQAQAGVLPAATVLYGGGSDDILNNRMNGTRVRFGWWFANRPNLGVEAEYVGFGQKTENFDSGQSTGNPILARPFYNAVTGMEDSELVAYPGLLTGRIQTQATSRFNGAAVRFRRIMCCSSGCGFSPIACGPVPTQSRIDATLGWRFFELKESLGIQESLTSQSTASPGSFILNDNFRTRNLFNGAELGFQWMTRRGYWSLDTLIRMGIGNTRQEVIINGSTQTTQNGTVTNANGGLLAQRTNSGTFVRNQFGVVPEIGATLGYQISQRMRLTAGYSFIYWSNVVRPRGPNRYNR